MQKSVTYAGGQEQQVANGKQDTILGDSQPPDSSSSRSTAPPEGGGTQPSVGTPVDTGAATGGAVSYSLALSHAPQQNPVGTQISPPQPATRTVRPAANYVEFAQMHQSRPVAQHQLHPPLPMRPPSFRGLVPDGEEIDGDRTLGGRVRGGDRPLTTDELRALFRQDGPESRRESKKVQLSTMRAELSAVRQVAT